MSAGTAIWYASASPRIIIGNPGCADSLSELQPLLVMIMYSQGIIVHFCQTPSTCVKLKKKPFWGRIALLIHNPYAVSYGWVQDVVCTAHTVGRACLLQQEQQKGSDDGAFSKPFPERCSCPLASS